MKTKVFAVIGAVCFAAAVFIGYFCNFKGDALVQIALEAFGFATLIIANVKKAKEEGRFGWKFVVAMILAVAGGILCAIGGVTDSIFATIAGAVLGIIAIFAGLFTIKK